MSSSSSSSSSSASTSSSHPFHGEVNCTAVVQSTNKKCPHGAYFRVGSAYYCGAHSNSKNNRVALKKKTAAQKEADVHKQITLINARVSLIREHNVSTSKVGSIVLRKLCGRRGTNLFPSTIAISPNWAHCNKVLYRDMSTLSPMMIGPIHHSFPHIVNPAASLERLWQGLKVYAHHVQTYITCIHTMEMLHAYSYVDSHPSQIYPKRLTLQSSFLSEANAFIQNPTPGRVARRKCDKAKYGTPIGSVFHIDTSKTYPEGMMIEYIESRFAYCTWMEAVLKFPQFLELKKMYTEGHPLAIYDFDAPDLVYQPTLEEIELAYKNKRASFGHGWVLITMLVIQDESKWPWRNPTMRAFHLHVPTDIQPRTRDEVTALGCEFEHTRSSAADRKRERNNDEEEEEDDDDDVVEISTTKHLKKARSNEGGEEQQQHTN